MHSLIATMRLRMTEGERRESTMHAIVMPLCGFMMFTAGGCVMQSTYDAALEESLMVKRELARAKEEQRVLARQVSEMELLNADVVREAEAAASALRQARDSAEQERQMAEQRVARLQQKAAQGTKQQRSLRYELTVAKENTAALQELIDVYQKKVRDGATVAAESPFAEPAVHKPFDPSTIPVPQDLPPAPAVAAPQQPVPTPTPAPAPSASPPKHTPPPPDEGWLSSITNWLLSLWHSVFS
jgi:hypothetical protein